MRENEQSWICTGGIMGRLWYGHLSHESEGHPGAVGFPASWVNAREKTKHDIVGFKHTHPSFTATPSLRDHATMHAWVCSFGKPLMCLIEGVDGLKAYLYYDDESDCIRCDTVKQFGQLIVVVLPPKKQYNKPAVVGGNVVLPRRLPRVLQEIPDDAIELDEPPPFTEGTDESLDLYDDDLFLHTLDWDEYDHCDS